MSLDEYERGSKRKQFEKRKRQKTMSPGIQQHQKGIRHGVLSRFGDHHTRIFARELTA